MISLRSRVGLFGSGKGRFDNVKSYTVYYGHPTEQAMRELAEKDLAIIEPTAYTTLQIDALRAAGTIVIGYFSVMEAPTWNAFRQERLQPDDYLLLNGERVHFAEWDSYLADLRRTSYRTLLLGELEMSIAAKGLDGVFLDTVGDIDEYVRDPMLQTELRLAYRELLEHTARLFPRLALLQNRGFGTLETALPFLHGFVWEDWRPDWEQDAWTKTRVKRLAKERKRGLHIFTISHNSDPVNAKAAGKLNFVHLNAPNGFTETVN